MIRHASVSRTYPVISIISVIIRNSCHDPYVTPMIHNITAMILIQFLWSSNNHHDPHITVMIRHTFKCFFSGRWTFLCNSHLSSKIVFSKMQVFKMYVLKLYVFLQVVISQIVFSRIVFPQSVFLNVSFVYFSKVY